MKAKPFKAFLKILILLTLFLSNPFLNFPQNQTQAKDIENLKFPLKTPIKTPIPGRINGKGSYFEIKDSRYLNVSLFSEKEIEVSLESIPRMVSLILSSSTEATTTLTLKGFEPNKKYYKYEDSYKNGREILTDKDGSYTWAQNLSKPHHVWFQEKKGTIFLPDDCTKYGDWNPENRTCTLTQDLTESVEINTSSITLDCNGHSITGNGGGYGIYLHQKNNTTIENCIIINFSTGIELYHFPFDFEAFTKNNNLSNNVIFGNSLGIHLFYADHNTLIDNNVHSNREGIFLDFSSGNTLHNNKMTDNQYNFGVYDPCFPNYIDTSNTVDGRPIYYILNGANMVYDGSTNAGTFHCINCNNVIVKDLHVDKNYSGIRFCNTKNSEIRNVTALNNRFGIHLTSYSNKNKITGNTALNNEIGIWLSVSNENTIVDNTVLNNGGGIWSDWISMGNIITKNLLSNNGIGIHLFCVYYNEVFENNLVNNGTGILLQICVPYLNAKVYHNNFINNNYQGRIYPFTYPEDSSLYVFDNGYPEGGNYWSDYDTPEEGCFDENKDGFCDAPYTFEGGQDNYPFIKENGWILSKNQPPIPIINFSPKNPVKGIKVKFDASSSTDPDGEIKKFFWEIKRGEEILATSTAATTTFAFPENGEYRITLIATDNDGATSSTSTTIKVEPFSFAIITDLHIGRGYPDYDGPGFDDGYNGGEYYLTQRLRNVVSWINEHKENYSFKFVAVLGDIADTAEKSEFCKAKEILDELEIPYIPVFGNHDVWPYTEKESATMTLGEDFFERIFWSTTSIPCENASSTRNFETLLRDFNFERDTQNPKFKNLAFTFGGIHFIGLDFNSREKEKCENCGVKGEGVVHNETISWLKNRLNQLGGKEPVIILSHEPFANPHSRWLYSEFPPLLPDKRGNFDSKEIEEIQKILNEYETLFEGQQILANFGGHIHGFEKFGKEKIPISPVDLFMAGNWEYPSLSNISVVTTEALMVGTNEKDEDLNKPKYDKGILRIVRIFGSDEIDFNETAAKYNPEAGNGKEFVALNPYISWAYKFLENSSNPCIFLKSHPFTNRDISSFEWDLGDGEKRYGKVIPLYCYSAAGTYTITSTVTDAKTGWQEWITRKIEIKEGLFSKIIKIKNEFKEKTEIISQKIGENLLGFGNYLIKGKDRILLKIKHSLSIPVAELTIDFDETTGDIDLSQMIFDSNLKEKKSILYMPEWPKVVKEKILLLPK